MVRVPGEAMDVPSLVVFTARLDGWGPSSLIWGVATLPVAGPWNQMMPNFNTA